MLDTAPDSGRSRLALAISRWQGCRDRVAELETARDTAMSRRIDSRHARDEAAAMLERAKVAEPHNLVGALLNSSFAPPRDVAQAEDRLEKAEAQYVLACRGADALDQALEEAEREQNFARTRLTEAVAVVVTASPELATFLAAYSAAQARLQSLDTVLISLAETSYRRSSGLPWPLATMYPTPVRYHAGRIGCAGFRTVLKRHSKGYRRDRAAQRCCDRLRCRWQSRVEYRRPQRGWRRCCR
jgi:hypothetical protein